ncbi:putative ATP-dependent RNA helicase ythdc2-like protein [Chrysochromulina tobinii]|uniref:Putative ATP-dependent RNA helicase ythdc2-like protein n=1 Tax=Chrysochromulina tobinii TaxID=1460289 RepID=A0A0M0JH93_9EUKA|nr:putative ATP-dependent RNA helicase ythdc2-like protein [Chrysochromulina tobinii]|eukprot:KOO25951.1 putative ATP-dependent RNA helicase ythdc2-like protein [Chrysochromulina sp. CCMP291]
MSAASAMDAGALDEMFPDDADDAEAEEAAETAEDADEWGKDAVDDEPLMAVGGKRKARDEAPPVASSSSSVPSQSVPVVRVGARCHPVACYHLEQLQAAFNPHGAPSVVVDSTPNQAKFHPSLIPFLEYLLVQAVSEQLLPLLPEVDPLVSAAGAVLIFLPGYTEIYETLKALERSEALRRLGHRLLLLPLHSLQDATEQHAVLQKPPPGTRKVILATNLAESSITVPDVSIVIDLGLEKLPYYDARANTDTLLLRRCARASASQRAGRAGRVAPGVCLRLYPSSFMRDESLMPAYTPAEMQRTSLLNLLLKVKMIDPSAPPAELLQEAIQPPSYAAVHAAIVQLLALGALSGTPDKAVTTPCGQLLASLPVSVPLGRLLLLGEALGLLREASVLAASLSLPDPFLQPFTKGDAAAKGDAKGDEAAAGAGGIGAADLAAYEEEAKTAREDVSFFKPRLAHFTAAGRSEPLTTLRLFEAWQRTLSDEGAPKAAQYAHSQHASYKRLAELEALSRELIQRIRQQRVEFDLALPPAGFTLTATSTAAAAAQGDPAASAAAAVAAAAGGVEMTRDLLLHALLVAAFSPNFASGKAHAPAKVLDELARHRLEPSRCVYCLVKQDSSQGGAHLHQRHLQAALAPCGELTQAIISKSRGAGGANGAPSLQTSVTLAFGTSASAVLALRMAGLRGSLPVLLTNESQSVVGLAKLIAPQYACRLSFMKRIPADPNASRHLPSGKSAAAAPTSSSSSILSGASAGARARGGGAAGGEAVGSEAVVVDQNWHSAASVLSDDRPDGGRRYLVAAAWSRAGGGPPSSTAGPSGPAEATATSAGLVSQSKLVAHSATLLPARPKGAAELMIVAFSRHVILRPTETGDGALAAYVADGDVGMWVPLPWLLTPSALDEINSLRAALSAALGTTPAASGASAAALQLALIKMSVAPRPELSAAQAAAASADWINAPPPRRLASARTPDELLPPLALAAIEIFAPPADVQAAGGAPKAKEEDEALFMDDGEHGALELLG